MAKGRRGKPKRNECREQKKRVLLSGDGENLDAQLKALRLTTKSITGDGNCLFRALSDQYYGYDKHHKSIRQEVCHYLEQNKHTYELFVEDNIPFDRYLDNMRQDGCYGGHMIIVGFARLRQVDIKIYQPDMIYVIHGADEDEIGQESRLDSNEEESNRQILHIAYHTWEHYSSVRNIDGPYDGLPEVKDNSDIDSEAKDDDRDHGKNQDDNTDLFNSKEKVILTACPGTNIRKIRRLLIRYRGNPDKVIDDLYTQENKQQEPITKQGTAITTIITAINDKEDEIQHEEEETTSVTTTNTQQESNEKETTIDVQPEKEETQQHEKEVMPRATENAEQKTLERPPKRLTAQQKKYQAKMRQKERKQEKKQQAASKHMTASMKNTTETNNDTDNLRKPMKQLYI